MSDRLCERHLRGTFKKSRPFGEKSKNTQYKIANVTKSYFHYTNTLEKIISIIENGFYVRASLETNPFYKLLSTDFDITNLSKKYVLPIISLCEVPLSKVKNHMEVYGNYGIGMNKKWVIRNGFNPVIYYVDSSEFINMLYQKLKTFILKKRECRFKA